MPIEFMKKPTGPINEMGTLNVKKSEFKASKKNSQKLLKMQKKTILNHKEINYTMQMNQKQSGPLLKHF